MDRVVQEELEDGTAEFEKSEIRKDWIVFSAVMAKAIDVKRQFDDEENAAGALSMPSTHTPATNAHSMSPGGRGCQCDGRHCPRNEDKEAMCDIFGDPPMSRIKTMMDLHPAYRAYVDLRRSKEARCRKTCRTGPIEIVRHEKRQQGKRCTCMHKNVYTS